MNTYAEIDDCQLRRVLRANRFQGFTRAELLWASGIWALLHQFVDAGVDRKQEVITANGMTMAKATAVVGASSDRRIPRGSKQNFELIGGVITWTSS